MGEPQVSLRTGIFLNRVGIKRQLGATLTVREDEERGIETQRSLPPALPQEAVPVEVKPTSAPHRQKPTKTRAAVVAATLIVVTVQFAWIVALGFLIFLIVRIV